MYPAFCWFLSSSHLPSYYYSQEHSEEREKLTVILVPEGSRDSQPLFSHYFTFWQLLSLIINATGSWQLEIHDFWMSQEHQHHGHFDYWLDASYSLLAWQISAIGAGFTVWTLLQGHFVLSRELWFSVSAISSPHWKQTECRCLKYADFTAL